MTDDPRCVDIEFKGYVIDVYPRFGSVDELLGYGAAWLPIGGGPERALTSLCPTVGAAMDAAMDEVCRACAAEVADVLENLELPRA